MFTQDYVFEMIEGGRVVVWALAGMAGGASGVLHLVEGVEGELAELGGLFFVAGDFIEEGHGVSLAEEFLGDPFEQGVTGVELAIVFEGLDEAFFALVR